MYPGKIRCTKNGDEENDIGKTSDYLPGSNVYEKGENILGKLFNNLKTNEILSKI